MLHSVGQAVGVAALVLVVWVACAGVGMRIVPRGQPTSDDDAPPSWRQPGVGACVGLGVLLALGGLSTALHLPVWLVAVPFVVTLKSLGSTPVTGRSKERV